MVTPSLFWSLVAASFGREDHRDRASQKIILACLPFVRQRPEDYYHFLVDNAIKVPSALKQGFLEAHQKRTHKKGSGKKAPLSGGSRLSVIEGDHGADGEVRVGDLIGRDGGSTKLGGTTSGGNGSDGSDDASDTMSVFSCLSRETSSMSIFKEAAPVRLGGR